MKLNSLVVLVEEEEIIEFVGNLWKTEQFKSSHANPNGYIRKIVDRFARLPRVFFEMSNPKLENSHFSSWWNAMCLRDYANPGISDAYYLHEIWHAATMKYDPNMSWPAWYAKMGRNELEASINSEVLVYLELDGFREETFNHEIWADRFISTYKYVGEQHLSLAWGVSVEDPIRAARISVMQNPNPYDFTELQIANYGRQNLAWSAIWKDSRRDIEEHMAQFMKSAKIDRAYAARCHVAWLVTRAMATTEKRVAEEGGNLEIFVEQILGSNLHGVPFRKEAEDFAKIAKRNKEVFGNHLYTA